MSSLMIGMIAETFVHIGVGQAISAIDLPVARERTTDYPFIPGSGVKGAFRSWAKERVQLDEKARNALFGTGEGAGTVMFSDARLLLLPVRSLDSAYVWLTCPLLLERLQRDAQRTGIGGTLGYNVGEIPKVSLGTYCSARPSKGALALEEREFTRDAGTLEKISKGIETVLPLDLRQRLREQLVVISNDDFAWFARYALPVMAHNSLDDTKKVSRGALWYEETLPPDTVMYCLAAARSDGGLGPLQAKLKDHPYCQFGGNETLGQGWFHLTAIARDGRA